MTERLFSCYVCKERKLGQEFFKDRFRSLGVQSKCKECLRAVNKLKSKDSKGLYQKTKKYHAAYQKKYSEKFPERMEARNLVHYALKVGNLVKGNCEECGSEKVHAHHPDYSKPLEVVWLCGKHHSHLHKNLKNLT